MRLLRIQRSDAVARLTGEVYSTMRKAGFTDPFLSRTPAKPLSASELTRVLRQAIAAELDAIAMYEAQADATTDNRAAKTLRAIADEERVHVGEFQRLLNLLLPDEKDKLDEGAREVDGQPLQKAHVRGHWKTSPNGKRFFVPDYEDKRTRKLDVPTTATHHAAHVAAEARSAIVYRADAPKQHTWESDAQLAYGARPGSEPLVWYAIREALQNGVDAARLAVKKGQVKRARVEIVVDPDVEGEVYIDDNGIGMSAKDIQDKFLEPGGSSKSQEVGIMAGGFGLAKCVIFGAVRKDHGGSWEIRSRDNILTMEQLGTEIEGKGKRRQGTRITLRSGPKGTIGVDGLGNSLLLDRVKKLLQACDLPDVDVVLNGETVTPKFTNLKSDRTESVVGADLHMQAQKPAPGDYGRLWVRLHGLLQFSEPLYGVDDDLVVDVTPTVSPRDKDGFVHKNYPFSATRSELREQSLEAVNAWKQNILDNPLSALRNAYNPQVPTTVVMTTQPAGYKHLVAVAKKMAAAIGKGNAGEASSSRPSKGDIHGATEDIASDIRWKFGNFTFSAVREAPWNAKELMISDTAAAIAKLIIPQKPDEYEAYEAAGDRSYDYSYGVREWCTDVVLALNNAYGEEELSEGKLKAIGGRLTYIAENGYNHPSGPHIPSLIQYLKGRGSWKQASPSAGLDDLLGHDAMACKILRGEPIRYYVEDKVTPEGLHAQPGAITKREMYMALIWDTAVQAIRRGAALGPCLTGLCWDPSVGAWNGWADGGKCIPVNPMSFPELWEDAPGPIGTVQSVLALAVHEITHDWQPDHGEKFSRDELDRAVNKGLARVADQLFGPLLAGVSQGLPAVGNSIADRKPKREPKAGAVMPRDDAMTFKARPKEWYASQTRETLMAAARGLGLKNWQFGATKDDLTTWLQGDDSYAKAAVEEKLAAGSRAHREKYPRKARKALLFWRKSNENGPSGGVGDNSRVVDAERRAALAATSPTGRVRGVGGPTHPFDALRGSREGPGLRLGVAGASSAGSSTAVPVDVAGGHPRPAQGRRGALRLLAKGLQPRVPRWVLLRKAGPSLPGATPTPAGSVGMTAGPASGGSAIEGPKMKTPEAAGAKLKKLQVWYTPEQIKALGLVWRTLDVGGGETSPVLVKDLGNDEGMIVSGDHAFTRVKLPGQSGKKPREKKQRQELTADQENALIKKMDEVDSRHKAKVKEFYEHLKSKFGDQVTEERKLTPEAMADIIRRADKKSKKLAQSDEERDEFRRQAIENAQADMDASVGDAAQAIAQAAAEVAGYEEATGEKTKREVKQRDENGKVVRKFTVTSENALEIMKQWYEVRMARSDVRAVAKALKDGEPAAAAAVEVALQPLGDEEIRAKALDDYIKWQEVEINSKLIDFAQLGKRTSDKFLRIGAVQMGATIGNDLLGYAILPAGACDTLGTAGAAAVIAHHIGQKYDRKKAAKKLRQYIKTEGAALAADAHMKASVLVEDAAKMVELGTGVDAMIQWRQTTRYRDNCLQKAAEIASRAVGALETMSQVALALEGAEGEDAVIPGRATAVATRKMAEDVDGGLGLSSEDYDLVKRGGNHALRLKASGLAKLVDPKPLEQWQGDEEIADIKRAGAVPGATDWLPPGFQDKITLDDGTQVQTMLGNHQRANIEFWEMQERVMVGDEVGTGKTVTALGGISQLMAAGKVKRTLIVVPNSVFDQFANPERGEIKKFMGDEWVGKAIAADSKEKGKKAHDPSQGYAITLITHDGLRNQEHMIRNGQYDAIVVDEAHVFSEKGEEKGAAARKQAYQRIVKEIPYAMLMSGTLVKNDMAELYSMVEGLQPGLLGTKSAFMKRYGRLWNQAGDLDAGLMRELKQKLDGVLIGVKVSATTEREAGHRKVEIRPITGGKPITCERQDWWLDLSPEQKQAYRENSLQYLEAKHAGMPRKKLSGILAERQRIVGGGDPETNVKALDAAKRIQDNMAAGKKTLVFSTTKYPLDTLRKLLGPEVKVDLIDGDVSSKERLNKAIALKGEDGADVILCTDAVNFGLNMTGASEVIHMTVADTAARMEQRNGRVARNGQKEDVHVANLFGSSPLEIGARQTLDRKGSLLEVMDGLTLFDEHGLAGPLAEYFKDVPEKEGSDAEAKRPAAAAAGAEPAGGPAAGAEPAATPAAAT